MNTRSLLIIQADIAVDASPVRQIDVVPLVQLERTIDKRRVFGEQLHTDTPAAKSGIHPQIDSLFLLCIEVLDQHLCPSVADIAIEVYFECFLIGFGRTDDSREEIQSVCTMLQVDADGVHRQAIRPYMI